MALKVALMVHRFPPYLGGCEMYSIKLAEGLTDRGHDVTVFTTKHPDRETYPFEVREFKNVNPPKSGYFFWPAFLKPSVLGELKKFDIIHAMDFSMFSAFAGLLAGRIYSIPTVLTTLYHPPSAMPHPWLKVIYDKTVGRWLLSEYNALIVHSQFELNAMIENVSSVEGGRLHRIASGASLEGVTAIPGFRDRYGLADKFIALYVGRIDFNKGLSYLFRAINTLRTTRQIPNITLAIVGEQEQWYQWPATTASLIAEMHENLVFTGRLSSDALASAYAESDVVVVSSEYESFGLTIVEALSYGTPVVSARVGIAPELIVDGYNGYLYNFGDVEGLKKAVLKMIQQEGSLRHNAVESVKAFRWDKTLETITALYYSLLDRSPRTHL